MAQRIDDVALDTIFRQARTYSRWRDTPVGDDTLRELYDVLKWAPTSATLAPARFAFLRTRAAKDEEFFAAGKPCFGCDQEFFPEGRVRANFLCNLGYGDPASLQPRLPRLAFNEACTLL